MSRIYLASSPDGLDVPRGKGVLWVTRKRADLLASGQRSCTRNELLESPQRWLHGVKRIVAIGLVSQITTPSNRVKVGQWLTDPLPGVERWSVDPHLFIVDPWRLWWHFGCGGVQYGENCTTSYRLETFWGLYLQGRRENPCSPAELERWGDGEVSAIDPFAFTDVRVEVVKMGPDVHRDYQAEKARAFDEEKSITKIVRRLGAWAGAALPCRTVPTYRELTSSPVVRVVATDLGVDRFLVRGLQDRIGLVNFVARRFKP